SRAPTRSGTPATPAQATSAASTHPAVPAATVEAATVVVVAATEPARDPVGVVVIHAELAHALRTTPGPIHVGELLGHSANFHNGDAVYVTSRGDDGGQSVIAIGLAKLDADA